MKLELSVAPEVELGKQILPTLKATNAYGSVYALNLKDVAFSFKNGKVVQTAAGDLKANELGDEEMTAAFGGLRAVAQLKITDTIAPVTTAVASPNLGNGWSNTDVSVQLNATDDGSGVDNTQYRINDGEWQTYAGTIVISTDGENVIEYRSTDKAGNTEKPKNLVVKLDKTAPVVKLIPDKKELWPANHKMVTVTIGTSGTVDPLSGIQSIILKSITSNEAENGTGDGNTSQDIQNANFGTSDFTFDLRAERSGNGKGRVYTITYIVTDKAGNKTTAATTVTVPQTEGSEKPPLSM
ncbi:OmpL47-type beta-barrel domain-containing protein [Paenibacillus sp. R14(2021)]|uniref:OmpL47-type beta-barrel domain-containing protein n=1 Tax=Paenibacillus sp. R14(2021) TaxID=2859228 RepID=UPI001C611D6A|nr:Ig-like domain repeat protein [Paenibacillus sp. R14(2021)]